jgi:hypothetical protein
MSNKIPLSRRSFLKTGLAAGGLMAFPQILPSRLIGATSANGKLNIAVIGCGNRSAQDLPALIAQGDNIVALCDVDPAAITAMKAGLPNPRDRRDKMGGKKGGKLPAAVKQAVANAKVYEDFRVLLEREKSLDAVLIATGQRWHMPISKAALQAGKHVFCEKPLAHSVAEARDIAVFMRGRKEVTQIGTQGGATDTFRRSMEIIQAGLLGQVRQVYCWMDRTFAPSEAISQTPDRIPTGLNWDAWCGPAPVHPFKDYYLGGCLSWGRWLDYGDGHLADMGAHAHNLPMRALELGPPIRISVESSEAAKDSYPSENKFQWHFAARGKYDPVTVWWIDGPNAGPPADVTADVRATYGKVPTNGVRWRHAPQDRQQPEMPRRAGSRVREGAAGGLRARPRAGSHEGVSRCVPRRRADLPAVRHRRARGGVRDDRHGGDARRPANRMGQRESRGEELRRGRALGAAPAAEEVARVRHAA